MPGNSNQRLKKTEQVQLFDIPKYTITNEVMLMKSSHVM